MGISNASRVWATYPGYTLSPHMLGAVKHMTVTLVTKDDAGEGDESEEEGKDEAPPELPAFQFSQEAMLPGQEYFQSENGLASLMRKVTEVRVTHLGFMLCKPPLLLPPTRLMPRSTFLLFPRRHSPTFLQSLPILKLSTYAMPLVYCPRLWATLILFINHPPPPTPFTPPAVPLLWQ